MKFLFFIIYFLGTENAGFSQYLFTPKLDSFLLMLEKNNQAMGSLAISKEGKMVYSKAFGFCSKNSTGFVPSTVNTPYRIGSVTKLYTATMIFQLLQENKLSLEEKIDAYFPTLPNSKIISIENLLNHRSGFPELKRIPSKARKRNQKEMLEIVSRLKPQFLPGTSSLYSNVNYLLLGYIIETVTGQSFEKVLDQKINERLKLSKTTFASSGESDAIPFHFKNSWRPLSLTHLSIPGAAGGMLSTPTEMVIFMNALFNTTLINHSSLEKMYNLRDDYGMGMLQYEYFEKKAYGHPGGIDGFESILAYFPGEKMALAYCSNGVVMPLKEIMFSVLNIYFNRNIK